MTVKEFVQQFVRDAGDMRTTAQKKAHSDAAQQYVYANHPGNAHVILGECCKALQTAGLEEDYCYVLKWDRDKRTWHKSAGFMREPRDKKRAREQGQRDKARSRPACADYPTARQLIDTCQKMIDSQRWSAIFAALLPLTGRREIEIGTRGTFWADSTRAHYLYYSGQAKTRSEARQTAEHVIPTLIPAKTICDAIQLLRAMERGDTKEQGFPSDTYAFNAKVANNVGSAVRAHFTELFGNRHLKAHDMRRVYPVYAFKWFAAKGQKFDEFLTMALGYSGQSASIDHYKDFEGYRDMYDTSLDREELQQ